MLAQIMSNNAARSSAFGPNSPLRLPFSCAVKTGTSTDFRDNWCLGFTAEFTVGVWAGNLDNTPMRGISGVTGAGPIFQATMLRLHRDRSPTWFKQPEDMMACYVHTHTGKRLPENTERTVTLTLPTDQIPLSSIATDYDSKGRVILDARYHDWLTKEGDKALFTSSMNMKSQLLVNPPPLRILSPSRDAKYMLDPDLPGNGKFLQLSTDFPGSVSWSSSTLRIETTNGQSTATLTSGTHHISLTDSHGRESSRVIVVDEL